MKRAGIKTIVILTFTFAAMPLNLAWARGDSNPQAVAMGGAFTALGRGYDAPNWNPANLGLSDSAPFSINIFSLGLRFRNNSFSITDYNRYNGDFLDESEKEDILDDIPAEGLRLEMTAEASAFNFSLRNIAFSYKAYGATSVTLDKDPMELLFFGNAIAREVSLTNCRGEAYVLGDLAMSYGTPVKRWLGGEIALGGSIHYLEGLAHEKIVETEGGVVTTDTGFVGSGSMLIRSSRGGNGYSTDLGLAVRFERDWYFSAVWQNLASRITWGTQNEDLLLSFDMKPITLEDIGADGDLDSMATSDDTTIAAAKYSSRLSPQIRLGLAKKGRNFTWTLDWEQTMFTGPGGGVNPRISTGLEYRFVDTVPVRIGMGFGGAQGSVYSIGMGLNLGAYRFDIGIANCGSPAPGKSQGIRAAIGMSLYF